MSESTSPSVPLLQSDGQIKENQRQETKTQRYVPPSLRKKLEESALDSPASEKEKTDEQARRTLEALEMNATVEVLLKVSKDLAIEALPQHIMKQQQPVNLSDEDIRLDQWIISIKDINNASAASALFEWFARLSQQDEEALLTFPSSLSKKSRAALHTAAEQLGLGTSSQGCGDDRFLTVYPQSSRDYIGSGKIPLSEEEKKRALQLWEWVKAEGDEYCQFSRNEIDEMVVGGKLHEKIEQLEQRHIMADMLFEAAQRGDIEAVDNLLSQDLSLLNVTSKEHKELPLYGACVGSGSDSCPPTKMGLYLLQRGASINALNSKGQSVLHLCKGLVADSEKTQDKNSRDKQLQEIIEALQQNGAHDIAGWPKRHEANRYQGRAVSRGDSTSGSWRAEREANAVKHNGTSIGIQDTVVDGMVGTIEWGPREGAPSKREDVDAADAVPSSQKKLSSKGIGSGEHWSTSRSGGGEQWGSKERRDGGQQQWDNQRKGRGGNVNAGGGGGFGRVRQDRVDKSGEGDGWKHGAGSSRGTFGSFGGAEGRQRTEVGGVDWRQGGQRAGGVRWGDAENKGGWRERGDGAGAGEGGGDSGDWRGAAGGKGGSRDDEMALLRGITAPARAVEAESAGRAAGAEGAEMRGGGGGAGRGGADEDEDKMVFRPVRAGAKRG